LACSVGFSQADHSPDLRLICTRRVHRGRMKRLQRYKTPRALTAGRWQDTVTRQFGDALDIAACLPTLARPPPSRCPVACTPPADHDLSIVAFSRFKMEPLK
jgi:hypothetical protein